jgi:hypothetical protein
MRGSDGSVFFARRASVRCQGLQPLVRGDLFLPSFPPGRADERRSARRPCREENEISGRPNQGLKSLARFVRPPDESHPCPHAKHVRGLRLRGEERPGVAQRRRRRERRAGRSLRLRGEERPGVAQRRRRRERRAGRSLRLRGEERPGVAQRRRRRERRAGRSLRLRGEERSLHTRALRARSARVDR